jgi:hypothetical protein
MRLVRRITQFTDGCIQYIQYGFDWILDIVVNYGITALVKILIRIEGFDDVTNLL